MNVPLAPYVWLTTAPEPVCESPKFQLYVVTPTSSVDPLPLNVQVSPEQRAEWLGGDPWSGHIEDGKLYGRGATDMKGGNAAFAWAVRCLAAAGFRPAADLIVTYSIGEETGEAEIGPLSVLERGYRVRWFLFPKRFGRFHHH